MKKKVWNSPKIKSKLSIKETLGATFKIDTGADSGALLS